MEIESLLPKSTYGGIKRSFRRRRYQRLDGDAATDGRKMKVVRLKGVPRKNNWRIKAVPKLRWVVMSPLKMLTKLKNAYVNFTLRSMNPDNVFGKKRIVPKGSDVSFKGLSNEEFEARLIFEISKALVASHELHPL